MRNTARLAALALLTAAPVLAAAQTTEQRARAAQGQTATQGQGLGAPMAQPDGRPAVTAPAEFMTLAAASDQYEVQSSRLAQERTRNPRVRDFAAHMIRDHEKTSGELQGLHGQVAGAPALPTAPDGTGRTMLDQLRRAQGEEFDRLYLEQQLTAHQQAIALFRGFAQGGQAGPVRDWAARTLPALEEHLRLAQGLHAG